MNFFSLIHANAITLAVVQVDFSRLAHRVPLPLALMESWLLDGWTLCTIEDTGHPNHSKPLI